MPKKFSTVTSKLVPILSLNVDTDQIIPAQYVNVSGEAALAAALFANRKAETADFVLNRPEMKNRTIMLCGPNFGCGSSREAAAWALAAGGFRAFVGTTFNETFARNCVQSCLPTVRLDQEAFDALVTAYNSNPDLEVRVDLEARTMVLPDSKLSFPTGIDEFTADLMVKGIDELTYLLERRDLIAKFEMAQLSPLGDNGPQAGCSSSMKRYVILGNGIAGQTCAEELRKVDPNASITMLAAEPHPLYSRVALPGFIRGQLREDKVFLRSFGDYEKHGIDAHFETRGERIDVAGKVVHSDRGKLFKYDAVLIATGGRPKSPPWSVIVESPDILSFQTIDDAKRIIARTDEAKRVVVIGGSFIGYELAEGIVHRKKAKVTWMIRGPRFLRTVLDDEAGELCRRLGEEAGVSVVLSDNLRSISRSNGHYVGETEKGKKIEFDVLAYGLGLDYYIEPAADGGVEIRGGIVTDQRMRTCLPDVYAAGDIAYFYDLMVAKHHQIGTWDNALGHGRTAAHNMAGGNEEYFDVPTYTTTIFGSSMAVLGITDGPPGLESVRDFSYERPYYRRLFFYDNRLVGAVLIGPPKGRKKLIEIMRSRQRVEQPLTNYLDPAKL
jgi:3-isopropylmalate dehydratase small subunit